MKYQKKLSDFILLLLSFFGDCLECPQGLYGRNCSNKCSEKCFIYKDCNIKTGVCFGGCAVGWKPPLCNEGTYILFTSISTVYDFRFTVAIQSNRLIQINKL